MNRKSAVRILLFAILLTAFYFAIIRNKAIHQAPTSSDSRNRNGSMSRDKKSRSDRSERGSRASEDSENSSGVSCGSEYFTEWKEPGVNSCSIHMKNGYPIPDPHCTPGGFNPAVSVDVLRNEHWKTRSIRNCETSEARKHIAYAWYDIQKPRINSNQNQVCELDHLVPLELGGADGLGNIWPQCGPDDVALNDRYFKRKDRVENYLAAQVRSGQMSLQSAQRGIASDWTQYFSAADQWCRKERRC